MQLILQYQSGAGLKRTMEQIGTSGGVLVKVEAREVAPGQSLDVVVRTPAGEAECQGEVIQALGEHGLAIRFELSSGHPLLQDGGEDTDPVAQWSDAVSDSSAQSAQSRQNRNTRATDLPLRERLKAASKAERIQIALHGSKPERNLLIRSRDKSVHQYVIRSPKIGLDEVAAIAKMSTVAPDVLAFIASKREWFQRPEIASALVRNPKVAASLAKKLLRFVSARELRTLAKGAGVREAIAQEARRHVLRGK